MVHCVNKNSQEFKALAKQTNINPIILAAKVSLWQEKNGLDNFPTINDLSIDNIKYQLNTNSEEYIASEKTIRDLAARMSDRIGVLIRFESDRTKQYKGKLENNTAVINLAYATLDTPVHEILGHPIIRTIKNKNSVTKEYIKNARFGYELEGLSETEIDRKIKELENQSKNQEILYQNLLKELETGKGKEVLDRIKKDYAYKEGKSKIYIVTEKDHENGKFLEAEIGEHIGIADKYTLEEQQEEAIVELLGLMTAEKLDAVKDGKLISLLKRLLKEIKQFVRSLINQKEVEIDKLPDNLTIGDLADILAYSNSKLILPGNEVLYTTPDNQQFKTYQEASNHISELAKNIEEVDLDNISLSNFNMPDKFEIQEYDRTYVYEKRNGQWYEYLKGETFFKEEKVTEEYAKKGYITNINKLQEFIEKNKEYEQSKEIIEEWKKINNIQYNPEEIYSRGQEFSSVVGAYSDFDVNLMMQNLLQHIEDNEKAGGKFAISAYTKPIDKSIGHLEGGGGKIKFKIYPQSNDILWAANIDVFSGSVWDAAEKTNKDKKSELLGVSYTKYPSLKNVNSVQPNLASIVDNLAHHHNELGITLTGNNFRLEYDEDIPYTTKKIINGINAILDQKYGKLVKPNIEKFNRKDFYDVIPGFEDDSFNDKFKNLVQPTQTNETLKENIESVKSKNTSLKENQSEEKKYTSQALINSKISALKEVAKKYPRSLIRSEVVPINLTRRANRELGLEDMFGDDLPFQKIPSLQKESLNPTQEGVLNILQKLSKQFNIEVDIDSDIPTLGIFKNGRVIINPNKATLETAFHEFAHPFVEALYKTNKVLYNRLLAESKKAKYQGKSIYQFVKDNYSSSDGYTDLDIDKEAVVTAIGLAATTELDSPGLLDAIKVFLKRIAKWIGEITGANNISDLSSYNTIDDIARLMKGNKSFDLSNQSGEFYQKETIDEEPEPKLEYNGDRLKKVVEDVKKVIFRQIAVYKKRKHSEKMVANLEGLQTNLATLDDLEAVIKYIEDTETFIGFAEKNIQDIKDGGLDRDQSVNKLNRINQFISSYDILDEIRNTFRDIPEIYSNDVYKRLLSLNDRRVNVKADFDKLAKDKLTDWFFEEQELINQKLIAQGFADKIVTREQLASSLEVASQDIGYFANLFEAAISSNDPILALTAKKLKQQLFLAEDKLRDFEADIFNAYDAVEGNKNNVEQFNAQFLEDIEIVEEKKVIKDGNVVIDENGHEVYEEVVVKNKSLIQEYRYDKFASDAKAADYSWEFYVNNTVVAVNAKDKYNKAKEELTSNEFETWKAENTRTVDYNPQYHSASALEVIGDKVVLPKIGPAKLSMPSSSYKNNRYNEVRNNPYYKLIAKQYEELNHSLPAGKKLIRNNIWMIPQVIKNNYDRTSEDGILNAANQVWKENTNINPKDESYGLRRLTGEKLQTIPVFYTKSVPFEDLSSDLLQSMMLFSKTVEVHNAFAEIQDYVEVLNYVNKDRKVLETNTLGKNIKDGLMSKMGLTEYIQKTNDVRVVDRLNTLVDMVYYGESDVETTARVLGKDVSLDKLSGNFMFWTSLTQLAGNVTAGLNNTIIGNWNNIVESLAEKHSSPKALAKAKAEYFKNAPQMLADIGKRSGRSKLTLVANYMDAMQGNFLDSYGNNVSGDVAKRLFSTDTLFAVNNMTEHEIQVSFMLSMLYHNEIDGKNLYDLIEVKDGKLIMSPEVKKKLESLKQDIHSVNKSLHGNYNKFDKPVIQRKFWGKLMVMYRKYIYTGFKRRWGSGQVDYESGNFTEGYYLTFFSKLARAYKAKQLDMILNWDKYSSLEKEAFIKTSADIAMIASLTLLAMLLGPDDDEDEGYGDRGLLHNHIYLQTRRFRQDITFFMFSPTAVVQILKSPTVSMTYAENLSKLLVQLGDPLETYEKRSGINEKGDSKLYARFRKVVPLVAPIEKALAPEEQLKYMDRTL